jgi:hypothetical protein
MRTYRILNSLNRSPPTLFSTRIASIAGHWSVGAAASVILMFTFSATLAPANEPAESQSGHTYKRSRTEHRAPASGNSIRPTSHWSPAGAVAGSASPRATVPCGHSCRHSACAAPTAGCGIQCGSGPSAGCSQARRSGECCSWYCQPDESTFHFRVEHLQWWSTGMNLPPLVTMSPPGTPVNQAGVLGAPQGDCAIVGNLQN